MDELEEVKNDILRYKEVLESMLADIYEFRPELVPRLHQLITLCNAVISLASNEASSDSKLLIGLKVESLKDLTEEFLTELSNAYDQSDELESYGKKAAA